MRCVSFLWRGPAAPHLIAYRAEVVHFSADTQAGTVRLLHRLHGATTGAVTAAEKQLDTDWERSTPPSVSFTAQQVFLAEPAQDVPNLQEAAGGDGGATCVYPCTLSCGCPMLAFVERPRLASEARSVRATPSQPPAVRVHRLFVLPDSTRPSVFAYYARLPVSTYERWRREGSDVIGEALKEAEPRRRSPLQRRYLGVSTNDVEVLDLLGLTDLLGSASVDAVRAPTGSCPTQHGGGSSPTSVDAVDAIPM